VGRLHSNQQSIGSATLSARSKEGCGDPAVDPRLRGVAVWKHP
jgi:hypothetical protein